MAQTKTKAPPHAPKKLRRVKPEPKGTPPAIKRKEAALNEAAVIQRVSDGLEGITDRQLEAFELEYARVKPLATWRRARAAKLKSTPHCEKCAGGEGRFRPGQPFKVEASECWHLLQDADRVCDPSNLMSVCNDCYQQLQKSRPAQADDVGNAAASTAAPMTMAEVVGSDPRTEALSTKVHVGEIVTVEEVEARYGTDGGHAAKVQLTKANRRVMALQMRATGADYRAITEELNSMGFRCTLKTVFYDIKVGLQLLADFEKVTAERIREMEAHRLDLLQSYFWPAAERGDFYSGTLVLKCMELRMKLFGAMPSKEADPKEEAARQQRPSLARAQLRARLESAIKQREHAQIATATATATAPAPPQPPESAE